MGPHCGRTSSAKQPNYTHAYGNYPSVTHLSCINFTIIIHVQCRATLQAIGLYLEAFQKIADAATNSKGLLLHFIPDASLFVCLKCVCVFDCSFFIFYLQEQPKILVPLSREYAYVSEQLKAELNHLLGKYKFWWFLNRHIKLLEIN